MGAVFAPADKAALKAAVGTCTWQGCTGGCLGETPNDGSCPIFAATDDGTGNPYGVIGDWDVSAVTDMQQSKCNLFTSPRPRLCHGPVMCLKMKTAVGWIFCYTEDGDGGGGIMFMNSISVSLK